MATKSTATKKTTKKSTAVKKAVAKAVPADKKTVIKKHAIHEKDTGSSQVQVALLTEKINTLSEHLESNPNDNHSRRGLIGLVGKRREHLRYLKMKRPDDYEKLLQTLKLRK